MSVFELVTDEEISAFDEDFEAVPPPPAGAPDPDPKGPNRFTIWIPSEQVVVNMGAAVHRASAEHSGIHEDPSATVQVDKGYVAQTEHHIHLHTFGVPETIAYTAPNSEQEEDADVDAEALKHKDIALGRTVLRLGTPGVVTKAQQGYGSREVNRVGAPTGIGSAYPRPFNNWSGYAMIAEGCAYQESQANHFIVSGTGDVRIAGYRSVLLGSPGDVHIAADGWTIEDIVGNDGDNMNGSGEWVGHQRTEHAISLVTSALGTFWGFATALEQAFITKYARSPKEGEIGWKGAGFSDYFGSFTSSVGTAASVYGFFQAALPSSPGGNVAIYGCKGFTGYGAVSATIHAGVSASLSSSLVSQVSSNLSTSISSMVATSVTALTTSMSGFMSASVSSQMGSTTIRGKSSAELSSQGKVFVASKDNAQLNSTDGKVFIHGKKGFYIGAGAGPSKATGLGFGPVEYEITPGYGILGTPDELTLCRMEKAGQFNFQEEPHPRPDQTKQISLCDSVLVLRHQDASIRLENNQVKIGNGKESRILLG